MSKLRSIISKTWVFAAAAALVVGSSSAMAFTLNNNVPESASANAVSTTQVLKNSGQVQPAAAEPAGYTVVDLSKSGLDSERKAALKTKLDKSGMTPEQIEKEYNTIIANMTPGEKDISAEQAAAFAADILEKAYGVDFTGYTAEASFSRNPVPYTDNWTVIFHAPQETQNTKRYLASVNSVDGTMLDASSYDLSYQEENSRDLQNPEWKDMAVQKILKLLPENVSIASSKVVSATTAGGVSVVCELSDSSAMGVRLTGENKEAAAYIYFPNGYDGSLDIKPVTEKGVG